MKVYVVEQGAYENQHIAGIYTTVDAAMQAHPLPTRLPSHTRVIRLGGWQKTEYDGYWSNGLDWEDSATISKYDLEGPLT